MYRKASLTVFLLGLLATTLYSQKEGLETITARDMKARMTFFASDALEGRETGSRGNEAAAEYIQSNLIKLGLDPIPSSGSYYQQMPMAAKGLMPGKTFAQIWDTSENVIETCDSIVFLMPPKNSVDMTGEVVFAGFGFQDSLGYNDFEGIDATGKILMIMTGTPREPDQGSEMMGFRSQLENPKFGRIFGQSPLAVLYLYNGTAGYEDFYESGLALMTGGAPGSEQVTMDGANSYGLPFPVILIPRKFANEMLLKTGNNLQKIEDNIRESGEPASIEIPEISLHIVGEIESRKFEAPNVIGMIEGSDPELKNECIIYTAHFDHEGVRPDGEIMNGADDNASGSMGILEIAEAFTHLKKKPKRTVIFAWVNAEEKGLLGSRYYTNDPVFSMENTLLNINFDMIGRSRLPSDTAGLFGMELDVTQPGEIMAYTSLDNTGLLGLIREAASETGVSVLEPGEEIAMGSSDHASFLAKGVTAVCFHSGIHADLHQPGDDLERIDFDKMTKVSRMAFLLGYEIANMKELPDELKE